jgi:predicted nucleotidyltransferase
MSDLRNLPPKHQQALDEFVRYLSGGLQANLYSAVLYGSAVRGGFDARTSDINVLIVLQASTPEAHTVIGEAVDAAPVLMEPFVLGRVGIERSFRAFAPKFDSIKRHHLLLHGADPLVDYTRDSELAAFLLEQSLRNLRLRSVQAYIQHRSSPKEYLGYLTRTLPATITDLSEVLRFADASLPADFTARIPQLGQWYGVSEQGLGNLLDLSLHPRPMSRDDVDEAHRFLFGLLDRAVTRASTP